MFKKIASLVFIILTVSCTKELSISSELSKVSFEELYPSTKVTVSDNRLFWEQTDSYYLYNGTKGYKYQYVANGVFRPDEAVRKSGSYQAFYPYSWVKTVSDNVFTVEFPALQATKNGLITGDSFPFACVSDDLSNLKFKNLTGIIDFNIKTKTQSKSIIKATLVADKPIAGTALVNTSDFSVTMQSSITKIVQQFNYSVNNTDVQHLMFVLPPSEYNLTLTVTASDGSELIAKYKNVNIARSTITTQPITKDFISVSSEEYVILLNEGNWQSDNGQVSLIRNHEITNQWFKKVNNTKIGDTPEDIIYIPNKNLLAISVNWSNIIYFIQPNGKLVAQTENVPNCRHMCIDDKGYLYITSYAHETALGETYERGYVAKIDLNTYGIVSTIEVGYEPEGIAFYNGKLYVANTGGYAFSESHSYEHTVSVIDCLTWTKVKDVEILTESGNPVINLYGEMSQCGPYLCINSPGDYNSVSPATVIYNCDDDSYNVIEGIPCTYNTTTINNKFFTVGSEYSYKTNEYVYYTYTIDPVTMNKVNGYETSAGTISDTPFEVISNMQNPYCVYENPYTGHLYVVDAKSYTSAAEVFEFDSNGNQVGSSLEAYINPGHMIAVPSNVINETSNKVELNSVKVVKFCKVLSDNRKVSINDYYRNPRKYISY